MAVSTYYLVLSHLIDGMREDQERVERNEPPQVVLFRELPTGVTELRPFVEVIEMSIEDTAKLQAEADLVGSSLEEYMRRLVLGQPLDR